MHVTQTDIADLSDTAVRRTITALMQTAPRPLRPSFATRLAQALLTALRERQRTLALVASELEDDDAEGAIVDPGEDVVATARRAFAPRSLS